MRHRSRTTKIDPEGLRRGELKVLRRTVRMLEREVDEGRQLNKQVAEMIDVGEVLQPAEHRDEERLRALLKKYDATL